MNSWQGPSGEGQPVDFIATVIPAVPVNGVPTGTVNFMEGTTTVATEALNAQGTATFETNALAFGVYSITARYGGDSNYIADNSNTITQTVLYSTTTTLSSSDNPSVYSESVTITATVAGTGQTPTGTITFLSNGLTVGTAMLSSGTATFTASSLDAGSTFFTAVYGGDNNDVGSTSGWLEQTVNPAGTATTVTSSLNPAVFGQEETFTATVAAVSPATETPSGYVLFEANGVTVGAAALNAGLATFNTSNLSAGSQMIQAVYVGDNWYFNSSTSGTMTETVEQGGTSTGFMSSQSSTVYGQWVTLTATVTAVNPGTSTPTGMVTWQESGVTVGTGGLDSSGTAIFSTSSFSVGTHSITAIYGGDGNFTGSTSALLTQEVDLANTSAIVNSQVNASVFGQSVIFTATISATAPGSGIPSGDVTFEDNGISIGTGTLSGSQAYDDNGVSIGNGSLSGGIATFATSSLTIGNHSITAVYNGDANFLASTASALPQTVNRAGTITAIVSSLNPSVAGHSVTFTATVSASSPGSGTPTCTVTFRDGTNLLGTGLLSSGKASLSTSTLAAGDHTITAVYGGDGNFTGSTSSTLYQNMIPTVSGNLTWTGLGNNPDWSTPENWSPAVTPIAGDNLVFPTTSGTLQTTNVNNIAAGTTFNSITFSGTGVLSYSISGTALGLTLGITNSAGANTFGPNITLGACGSHTFTIAGGTTLTESGMVSGSGGLTESGGGTLTLSGNNTYSGNTVVNAGAIQALSNNALGNLTTETVKLNANATALELAGNITLTAAVTNSNTQANILIVENISGNNQATITQLTNSTWDFISQAGNLTISTTGAANVGAGSSFTANGPGNVILTNNGTRQIFGANTTLTANGTGTLSVTGNFSILVGAVVINSGATMQLGNGGSYQWDRQPDWCRN